MELEAFKHTLAAEGFPPPVQVARLANDFVDLHTHPFEAKALVVQGELRIVVDGQSTTYAAGQVFHLAHSQPHSEYYGPDGVEYWVGRKDGHQVAADQT